MAKMIMRLRGREPYEIESPDSHEGYDLPESVTSLGRWVGELVTRITTRQEVLGQLEAQGWKSTDQTRNLFRRLSDDVARYSAVPYSDTSVDFHKWLNLPGVRARLPDNTAEVIKGTPAAVVDQAIKKAKARVRIKSGHDDLSHFGELSELPQFPTSTEASRKFDQRLFDKARLKVDAPAKPLLLEDQRSIKDDQKPASEPSNLSDPDKQDPSP